MGSRRDDGGTLWVLWKLGPSRSGGAFVNLMGVFCSHAVRCDTTVSGHTLYGAEDVYKEAEIRPYRRVLLLQFVGYEGISNAQDQISSGDAPVRHLHLPIRQYPRINLCSAAPPRLSLTCMISATLGARLPGGVGSRPVCDQSATSAQSATAAAAQRQPITAREQGWGWREERGGRAWR